MGDILDYSGMKALVMGLGLHGGGLESTLYLARKGAELTVTDLRDEKVLAPTIARLESDPATKGKIRYVLGRHENEDFINADMVIKNPGVRADSPYLQKAKRIETDISLFLAGASTSPARLIAVTGSKGKSSTASAIHWVLSHDTGCGTQAGTIFGIPIVDPLAHRLKGSGAYLGGNITVSPLVFLDQLKPGDDVVLELSSWQLGDLRGRLAADGTPLLKPKVAVLTAIMKDHLNYYKDMDEYVADKRVIYQGQDASDFTVAGNDDWGRSFLAESKGVPLRYADALLPKGVLGGWVDAPNAPGFAQLRDGKIVALVPANPLVTGLHQKQNLLAAGLALLGLGLPPENICECLGTFPGIEHRMELFHEAKGIRFYNDSAATIPEAAAAALESLCGDSSVVLVTGGTDKALDFTPLANAAGKAKAIILLDGNGSAKLKALLDERKIAYAGPFDSLDNAVRAALDAAVSGDRVLLSPGCASFGMFLNEFDRGRKWKEAIRRSM